MLAFMLSKDLKGENVRYPYTFKLNISSPPTLFNTYHHPFVRHHFRYD